MQQYYDEVDAVRASTDAAVDVILSALWARDTSEPDSAPWHAMCATLRQERATADREALAESARATGYMRDAWLAAIEQRTDVSAALQIALDTALARATRAERALQDVGRAADLVAAVICDDCGNGRPVVDPERGIGHVVERGRSGPGDPDTVDSWASCEAEWMWQALRRAHAVELRVLTEPNS